LLSALQLFGALLMCYSIAYASHWFHDPLTADTRGGSSC
jgi:hypothetical protein